MKTQISPTTVPFNNSTNRISNCNESSESDNTLFYLQIRRDTSTNVLKKSQASKNLNTESKVYFNLV
jgi:hypothetical protein